MLYADFLGSTFQVWIEAFAANQVVNGVRGASSND